MRSFGTDRNQMTIYEPQQLVSGFRSLVLTGVSEDWDGWRELERPTPLGDRWIPPSVRFERSGESDTIDAARNNRRDSDYPWVGGALMAVFSARAVDALRQFLQPVGELLPVECSEGDFSVFHCLNQITDAIDLDRSVGTRSSRDGSLISVRKFVFLPAAVAGHTVFTTGAPARYQLFVSEAFVRVAEDAGLRGFDFRPVWSDQPVTVTAPEPPQRAKVPQPPSLASESARSRAAKPQPTSDKPLPQKTAKLLRDTVAEAARMLGVDLDRTLLGEVQQRIQGELDACRNPSQPMAQATNVSVMLGTLWGEIICRELGWQWAMVDDGTGAAAGIVSPTRSHAVFHSRGSTSRWCMAATALAAWNCTA